jgi:hypothetical protein
MSGGGRLKGAGKRPEIIESPRANVKIMKAMKGYEASCSS